MAKPLVIEPIKEVPQKKKEEAVENYLLFDGVKYKLVKSQPLPAPFFNIDFNEIEFRTQSAFQPFKIPELDKVNLNSFYLAS